MRELCVIVLIFVVMAGTARAQLDVAKLAEAHKAVDMARNDGKGHSDKADSGALGWGEGDIIQNYASMWEVTEDTYWLSKIGEHFHRIMDNASDPDGDGYLSWQTKRYSCAVAYAHRLHNVSAAQIAPERQKNSSGAQAAKCSGHTYIIGFHEGPAKFRIIDWDTREVIADGIEYEDGATIAQIEPFEFKITGQTHQGDRFMVRTIAQEPIEYVVHQGMFIYPVALFIEAARSRPELREQFGADAEEFLAFINKHVFEKNERDWLDMDELGGGYRFEPKITDRMPNRIMVHNQYGALARAWLVLSGVEGAHPLMATRAVRMVRYFHNHLELDEEHNAYRWYSEDYIEYGQPGHNGWGGPREDTSHGSLDVSLAIEAARRGVVFTDEDMVRIANTWLKVMWNQDEEEPLMANRVDGAQPGKHSALFPRWSELSQWDRKVYDLALTAFLARDEEGQVNAAPIMLLCAKRAGVELPQ